MLDGRACVTLHVFAPSVSSVQRALLEDLPSFKQLVA